MIKIKCISEGTKFSLERELTEDEIKTVTGRLYDASNSEVVFYQGDAPIRESVKDTIDIPSVNLIELLKSQDAETIAQIKELLK